MTYSAIHNWTINGRILGGYVYKCGRCGCTTVSGEPLNAPYNKTCLTPSKKIGNI